MIQFQENTWTEGQTEGQKDGRTEGRKDGQTLFYRTLPATAEGPIIKTKIKMQKIVHR